MVGPQKWSFAVVGTEQKSVQNDFPQLKYALLGGLGLLALVQRE